MNNNIPIAGGPGYSQPPPYTPQQAPYAPQRPYGNPPEPYPKAVLSNCVSPKISKK